MAGKRERASYGARASVGARFGFLVVVAVEDLIRHDTRHVVARCVCGQIVATTTGLLRVREYLARKFPDRPPISCGCAKADGRVPGRTPRGIVPVDR